MSPLDWKNHYNEFSRAQSFQVKSNGVIFKIYSEGNFTYLKLMDSYTGAEIKKLSFDSVDQAAKTAEDINTKLKIGFSLEQFL